MESTDEAPAANAVETRFRILLIEDDDLDTTDFLREISCRELPIEMQRARNAVEAMQMLRLQDESGRCLARTVIVLDLNMPEMNGLDFLAELRADPRFGNAVVFAFTTSEDEADIRDAYRHHVAGYVVKQPDGDATARLVTLLEHYLATVTLPTCGGQGC
ncbi:MAG TPA: response regulator [bacterium]|nr:response regulator [bacterium]